MEFGLDGSWGSKRGGGQENVFICSALLEQESLRT